MGYRRKPCGMLSINGLHSSFGVQISKSKRLFIITNAQPMPSPCPVCPMSYKRKICYVLDINGLHSSLGVQINSFLCCSFIFFLFSRFSRFSRFPYLHACGDWWSLFTFHTNWFGFSVHKYTFNTQYTLKHFFFLLMSQSFSVHFIRSLYHQCLQHRLIWNT